MLGLAALIALEKQWRFRQQLAMAVGVAALVFAAAVAFDSDLAPGLRHRDMPMHTDEMPM